ncbi:MULTISPECIES: response regulator [unclassified Aureimonas]|uniref:response regulator n=1 Tax=unclassified Aureimonas TaxID=2615206 RepID=UPI000701A030|nr:MULTISPECIES: response regulator [unclassified Aureimonas]KQT55177.1 hypothetical protein ASG62_10035 [Aureimonas sp. Leaf427]KQT70967.1 hypothetical protein ASG54_20420 [Aureimonas sp. Leaf460]
MRTCLIVDESSVIRKVAGRILFQLGFEARSASTGAEAMEIFGEGEPLDLVITAAVLPDMSGEDLVRLVRGQKGGNGVVILGSLVEANLGQMTRLKRSGANGFVYKPFNRETLSGWVDTYFHREAA